MFEIDDITFNVMELLDPVQVPGADYFNWFFTVIAIFALLCVSIQILIRIVSRS